MILDHNNDNSIKPKSYSLLFVSLLRSLTNKDPDSALNLLNDDLLNYYILAPSVILSEWSKGSPKDALEYYLNNQGKAKYAAHSIFRNYANLSYDEALVALMDHNSRLSNSDNLYSATAIGEKFESSQELLELISNENLDKNINKGLITGWASQNIIDAENLFYEIDDASQKDHLRQGIFKGKQSNFSDAMEWYYDSFKEKNFKEITNDIFKNNPYLRPPGLRRWLDTSQYKNEQEVIKPIVEHYVARNFRQAPEFLKYLTDKEDRLKYSQQIYEKLNRKKEIKN